MKNKFKDWVLDNIINIVILLITLTYTFTAVFVFSESGKSIGEIIVSSALILVLAYAISVLFDLQGIYKGEKTDAVQQIKKKHEETVILIEPYADKIDTFCENENKFNLKTVRTRFLAKAGLSYEECFDEKGAAKEIKFDIPSKPIWDKTKTKSENELKLEDYKNKKASAKFKRKMFKNAVKVRLTQLTSNNLISNSKKEDKFNFGPTAQDYLKKSNSTSLISKIAIALIYGYYTIQLIQDFQWTLLLWNCMQSITFIAFGVIKYFQAFLFMQNNFVDRTKQQISVLKKFYSREVTTPTKDYIDTIADKVAKKFEVQEISDTKALTNLKE